MFGQYNRPITIMSLSEFYELYHSLMLHESFYIFNIINKTYITFLVIFRNKDELLIIYMQIGLQHFEDCFSP